MIDAAGDNAAHNVKEFSIEGAGDAQRWKATLHGANHFFGHPFVSCVSSPAHFCDKG